MRRKYNIFKISKVNKKTIEIALQIKNKNDYKEVSLRNPENNNVPVEEYKFLGYISYKYLNLKPDDGIPLLKQAFKLQYKIEDEHKECKQCGKLFTFTRKSKDFCSNRCKQRFFRNQKSKKKDRDCYVKGVFV